MPTLSLSLTLLCPNPPGEKGTQCFNAPAVRLIGLALSLFSTYPIPGGWSPQKNWILSGRHGLKALGIFLRTRVRQSRSLTRDLLRAAGEAHLQPQWQEVERAEWGLQETGQSWEPLWQCGWEAWAAEAAKAGNPAQCPSLRPPSPQAT